MATAAKQAIVNSIEQGAVGSSLQWIRQVHSRLVHHLQHQSTDLMTASGQATRADKIYLNPHRDAVVHEAPAFIMPSCLLPRGHVVAETHPGMNRTPILIHRDATTGKVRAYINQCRHRGSALISTEKATVTQPYRLKGSAALTCPYHGWTYDIRNGNLKKIPGETEGFPCLGDKKSDLGLQSIMCTETAGGIWIGGDRLVKELQEWSLEEIDSELQDLWLEPPPDGHNIVDGYTSTDSTMTTTTTLGNSHGRLVRYREWKLNANWQLLVETFLESYHVQFLHQATLGRVTHGNRMVADRLDRRSVRHTVPLSNFFDPSIRSFESESAHDDMMPVSPKDPFFGQTTTTYFLFPNVAISLFKRFAIFLSIVPETNSNKSRNSKNNEDDDTAAAVSDWSRVRAFGVTHATAEGEDLVKQQRDLENVFKGIEEDWYCAEDIQKGLRLDTIFYHGRFEGNNIDFLRNVGEVSEMLQKR